MYGCMVVWLYGCWMYGCMDVWLYGCMAVWLYGCMAVWMYGCMAVWMYGCMDVWMYGCMVVWLYGCWMYGCMVVWLYGCMVVSFAVCREVARQLLQCCVFLHQQRLVHTDIKHKNVMFKHAGVDGNRPVSTTIKVIDYGNMTHDTDFHTFPIGTRQFRVSSSSVCRFRVRLRCGCVFMKAPEVQLGIAWDEKFDLWGVCLERMHVIALQNCIPHLFTDHNHVVFPFVHSSQV